MYPPAAATIGGTVTATVKTTLGVKTVVDPAGYRVDLFYAEHGKEADVQDTSAPFTFTGVHAGVDAVRAR